MRSGSGIISNVWCWESIFFRWDMVPTLIWVYVMWAQEHFLSAAFKNHDLFKTVDHDKISYYSAYTAERYSVTWSNDMPWYAIFYIIILRRNNKNKKVIISCNHMNICMYEISWEFNSFPPQSIQPKVAYIQACHREVGPEIHRHASWFETNMTYHDAFGGL